MNMTIRERCGLDIDDLHDQLEQAVVNIDVDGPTHHNMRVLWGVAQRIFQWAIATIREDDETFSRRLDQLEALLGDGDDPLDIASWAYQSKGVPDWVRTRVEAVALQEIRRISACLERHDGFGFWHFMQDPFHAVR